MPQKKRYQSIDTFAEVYPKPIKVSTAHSKQKFLRIMCKLSSILKIHPRCKQVDGQVHHPQPVVLSMKKLEEHFIFPLTEAAKRLGVCETSLKW